MSIIERLNAMRKELDLIIGKLEGGEKCGTVVTSFTELRVGYVVELLQDYTHYGDSSCSLPKGLYEVDMVEDELYTGSLNISFKSESIWYNFEAIRKQTQIILCEGF